MKTLYTTIANKIINSPKFTEANLKPIQHIDLFFNQYDNPDQEEIFDVPALFIELSLQIDERFRIPTSKIMINTHLILQKLETSAITQLAKSNPYLDIYTYRTIINNIIQLTASNNFSKIKYLETEPLIQAGPILILKEKYTSILYEEIPTNTITQQAKENEPININIPNSANQLNSKF